MNLYYEDLRIENWTQKCQYWNYLVLREYGIN